MGASSLIISPQLEKYSKRVKKKHGLGFEVLCDKGNKVASRYGLTYSLPDDLSKLYKQFGIDLEIINGDDSWTLPMPARFIINQQGIVQSASVNPDYTIRPEPEEIIKILKTCC